ncbi:Uncharacterised protein [Chlamydia trachomatis]|nr:Uncharacterised protein [Chlamydia trachomatis]
MNITELTDQIKNAVFFKYDSLTTFRFLQTILIVLIISIIYLVNLFFQKQNYKQFLISYLVALFAT